MYNINFRLKKGDTVLFKLSKRTKEEMKGEVVTDKLNNGTLWVKYKGNEFNIHKKLIRPIRIQ